MKRLVIRLSAAAAMFALAGFAAGETVVTEPDALLDYVEATGIQYIDTGVNAETGLKARIDFAWADQDLKDVDWSLLDACTQSNDSSKRRRIHLCHIYKKKPYFGYGLTRANPTNSVEFVPGRRCEIVANISSTDDLELMQDGTNTLSAAERAAFATNGIVNLNLDLFVFAANYGGKPSWYGQGRLYELQIFRKNATTDEFDLLRHYLPCTKDNRAGLYDKVNGTISFSSADFIAGSVTNAVSRPIEVPLFDEHPEWGYKVEGLGAGHDEMALVFTNQNASSMEWTVPADLTDVQFLVVGGGGGGGADYNPNSGSAPFLGGGGGGGGGVVTGVVSTVVAGAGFSIAVGAGGAGGQCNKTEVDGGYGASYAGSDSTVSLGGAAVLTAFGGGNDKGAANPSAKSGRVGGTGGSNAGSRGGHGGAQEVSPTRGSVADSFVPQLAGYGALGNFGGAGNATDGNWGYYSASGGGGGATTAGGTPTDSTTGGNGGEGFASDIAGTPRVYGSGGGGGTISGYLGGTGGTGAGSGNTIPGDYGHGQDALPNQGGGGGGGGRYGNGGAGGSGIVVLRFRVPTTATGYNDPQGNEITDTVVLAWLSENGFTQADIDNLGNDSAATDRLYECFLLGLDFRVPDAGAELGLTGIAVSNGVVSIPVQFVRKAPLGRINGFLYFYAAEKLPDFGRDPIEDVSVSFGENDDEFFDTAPTAGVVTQTVTAAIVHFRERFFKAAIEVERHYEPDE